MIRRSLFIPFLLIVVVLLHLTYLTYLSLFRTVELTKEYGFVWNEWKSDEEIVDRLSIKDSKEEAMVDYERESQQLSMFADVEEWCSFTNYTDKTALPSPKELAELHRKEDVWGELANTALIITNNFPWQSSIGLLQRMYQPYFKVVVFCGTFYPSLYQKNDGFPAIITPFHYINLTEEEVYRGFFVYLCLIKANYLVKVGVEGFFMMSDDATFNFWHTLDLSQVFHPTGILYEDYVGTWWPSRYGESAMYHALNLIKDKYRTSLRMQKMWKKYQDNLIANGFIKNAEQQLIEVDGWCMSDFFYVPTTQLQYVTDLLIIFFEAKVFHEIAISKLLHAVPYTRAEPTHYEYLWDNREKWEQFYNERLIMIHPIKFSQLVKLSHRQRFCNTVVRTFKQALFPRQGLTLGPLS